MRSISTPLAFIASYWLRTLSRVGSSTHSRRRSTVNGRIMRPYSEGLKAPSNRSAMFQIKGARVCWFTRTFLPISREGVLAASLRDICDQCHTLTGWITSGQYR
ncbi:hypothetical protein D9M71_790410 [compost metagenome]